MNPPSGFDPFISSDPSFVRAMFAREWPALGFTLRVQREIIDMAVTDLEQEALSARLTGRSHVYGRG